MIQNRGRKPRERYLTGTPWFRHSLEQAACACCDPRGPPQFLLANECTSHSSRAATKVGIAFLPPCSGVTAGAARACARITAGHGRATARGMRARWDPVEFCALRRTLEHSARASAHEWRGTEGGGRSSATTTVCRLPESGARSRCAG